MASNTTKYDTETGYKIWVRHLKGRASKEATFSYLERYVNSKAEKRVEKRKISGSLQGDEAVQQVRLKLLAAINRKRIPAKDSREMHAYLKSMVHNEVDTYPISNRVEFPPYVMYDLARRSNPSLEAELTLGDLPDALRLRVGASIASRFPEVSSGAAKYVLDRILNGESLSDSWMRRQYNLQEPRFFVESVMVALRMALYQMRDDIYPISKTLSGTLYGSFVEEEY